MSLNPAAWKLLRSREGLGLTLAAADAGMEAEILTMTIPRSEDAPSLGLLLEEIASSAEAGIVAIEGVVEGGNGEKASEAFMPGDALVAAASAGDPATGVALEGLTYDGVVEELSALDITRGVVMQVKRLKRIPRATVTVKFPQAEARPDEVITLYPGANLRRAMLSSGMVLNDPLARRFDAGIGTGDCGGEGTCCTCAIDVSQGLDALSPAGSQEVQILRKYPRWRLACKAQLGKITEDVDLTIKVQPRAWDNFYGVDEVDVDGVRLARERKRQE
jgi:hypothetical protein